MTTTSRPLARLGAGVLLALALTACGSAANDAVTSTRSLDDLGAALAKDGDAARLYLAGTLNGTEDPVRDDASRDVACSGGTHRVYRTSVTGPAAAMDGDRGAQAVRNAMGLAAQIAFKRVGYDLDGGKDQKDLPATLAFANDPSSKDQRRTFRTTVKVTGDQVTTTISGETACIKD